MVEHKNSLIIWIKKHKKELIIAGISVTAIIGIILVIDNRKSIEDRWKLLSKAIEKSPVDAQEVSNTKIDDVKQLSVNVAEYVNQTELMDRNEGVASQIPFEVSAHLRTLPEGCQASPEKIQEAITIGIILQPRQTLVDAYTKRDVARIVC